MSGIRDTRAASGPVSEERSGDVTPAEMAIRETTLYRFTDPVDRAAALFVGRMLHLFALERPPADASESSIRAALRAVAQDLRNLQGFLDWIWREGDDTEQGASGVTLTERADCFRLELGRIASAVEEELDDLARHRGSRRFQAVDDPVRSAKDEFNRLLQ
jgi:hypothetical protein